MKFCIEYGSRINIDTAKFCSDCGNNLLMSSSQPDMDDSDDSSRAYSLGIKLEVAEKILRSSGYGVTRREKLVGKTGTTHEINLVARRIDEIVAVECKSHIAMQGCKYICYAHAKKK